MCIRDRCYTFICGVPKLKRKLGCFELIGCDVLVDENFRPYLLELNSNPAIDIDTEVKIKVIPKVVYNGLDIVFDIHKNPADRTQKLQNPMQTLKLNEFQIFFNELTGKTVLEDFDCKTHLQ
eukprot:TRINITY_DN11783_c0_g1_i3.p3 TRINITY_DN11783_c0_g1~~TRINITY_DN11783_c0_g1_i3.p3  ORF type:complete len:122 (+),score=20.48 TRINITY_DN11783_c0_g1_i3:111-476(+)